MNRHPVLSDNQFSAFPETKAKILGKFFAVWLHLLALHVSSSAFPFLPISSIHFKQIWDLISAGIQFLLIG
ncbi:hypothetical protein SLA2020_333650 [Shorea laevis]